MTSPAAQPRYTVVEYLQRERESLDRHEYREGEILLMAGGKPRHSLICANVIRELGNHLKGKPCEVYESNLRVRIPRTVLYTYPDASVICGPPQYDPNDPSQETVTNPRLIVEVLSPTTEAYDRGEKFEMYGQIPSLEEYVLVSQATPRVETFWRQPGGTWLYTSVAGMESGVKLRCLEADLPLGELYSGVEFGPQPAP